MTPGDPDDRPWLRIRDATVRKGERGGRTILNCLSLDVHTGEHTAILGANGSGKSSLIKLIVQEYHPLAHGNGDPPIEIFGRERWDVFELRASLGLVSADLQRDLVDAVMAGSFRGLDVAVSGFFATPGVPPRQAVTDGMRERGRAALVMADAAHLADKLLREMSTGEARRVLIARALVPDPPIMLLDEPAAGLDIVARHHFLQTVRGLAGHGKTIVLVTHRLEEIIPEIARVVLLKGGRVLADGSPTDVLTGERLSDAFGAPLHVERTENGYFRIAMAE